MIIFNCFGIVALISAMFFGLSITALPPSLDPANIVFPQTIATRVILEDFLSRLDNPKLT